jgi:hypothetical protein
MSIQPWRPTPSGVAARADDVVGWVLDTIDRVLDAVVYVRDILPILTKYQIVQWTRSAIRRASFLLPGERRLILRWLHSHGW